MKRLFSVSMVLCLLLTCLPATPASAGDEYDYEGIKALYPDRKILGYVSRSVGLPIADLGLTFTILFDIDDLNPGATLDGSIIDYLQDDTWTTVWLNSGLSFAIGLNPTIGFMVVPGVEANVDPWFGPGAGYTIGGGNLSLSPGDWPTLGFEPTLLGVNMDFGTMYALDIRTSTLVDLINDAFDVDNVFEPEGFFDSVMEFANDNYEDALDLPKVFKPDHDVRYYAVGDGIYGDVQGDGVVDWDGDVILIAQHLASNITLTGSQFERADVFEDGLIDVRDALAIAFFDAGLCKVHHGGDRDCKLVGTPWFD